MIRLVLQYCQFHYVGISRFQEESILLIIPNANRNGFLWSVKFSTQMIVLQMKCIHKTFFSL